MFFLQSLSSFTATATATSVIDAENQRSNDAALLAAVINGHTDIIHIILAAGANKDMKSDDGYPLLQMAINFEHLEIIRILLAAGVNKEAKNRDGLTAFMFAAQLGNLVVMNMLLTAGANINALSSVGVTALLTAAFYGKTDVIRVLLSAGANQTLTIPDEYNYNALQVAIHTGHPDAIALLLTAHENTVDERARLFHAIEAQVHIQVNNIQNLPRQGWDEDEAVHDIQCALTRLKNAMAIKNKAESIVPYNPGEEIVLRGGDYAVQYDRKIISDMDFSTIDSMLEFRAKKYVRTHALSPREQAMYPIFHTSNAYYDDTPPRPDPYEVYHPSLADRLCHSSPNNLNEVKTALLQFRQVSQSIINTPQQKNSMIWSWVLQAYSTVFTQTVNVNRSEIIPDDIMRDIVGKNLNLGEKSVLSRTSKRHHALFQPELRAAKWFLSIAKKDQANVEQMETQYPELLSNNRALQIANNIGRTSVLSMGATR